MPDRIVRAAILDSKAFNELTDEAEVLYRRLLSVVDDFGCYEADPELIQAKCFWRKVEAWPVERVSRALADICGRTNADGSVLVRKYTAEGKNLLRVYKLGTPRAKKLRYPLPPGDTCGHPPTLACTCMQMFAGANTCMQTQADVGACEQTQANVRISNTTTTTNTTTNKESKREETDAKCDEFARLYPAHRLDNLGAGLFISSSDQDGILARLRLAVKSDDWTRENGRYVPKASKWITDGAPGPAMAAPAPNVASTMDPEIRRRLDERKIRRRLDERERTNG